VKTVAQSVLSRLELVTREEFDAQQAVLARTRERVQQLEAELLRLSQQLDTLEK
jgi:BMFP domain-containing protein YqiC